MNVRAATRVSAFCTWLDLRGDRQVGVFLLPELKLVQRLEPPAWWASRYPQPQLTD